MKSFGGVEKQLCFREAAGCQRARDGQGGDALLGGEVTVARGQREAVGVAHDRAAVDTHGKVQVIHHLTDQRELLVVLLAEKRVRGAGQREQLRHHREHAREVRRPGRALQHPAERTGLDRRARAVRVHRLGGRREDSVDAEGLKLFDVLSQRPRILLQILARRELQRVDKDADHHGVAQRFGGADEGEVAAMKRAHGGHEGDGAGRKRRSQRFRSVHELGHTPIIYLAATSRPSPPSATSTWTVSPSTISPASSFLARRSPMACWIRRRSGRAP